MGICEQCKTAIVQLHPQDSPNVPGPGISISLPRYHHDTTLNCWICAKLSEWLSLVSEEILEDWHKQALEVEYSCAGGVSMEEGPSDDPLPFVIRICPSNYHGDEDCLVELNFFSSQVHETLDSGRFKSSTVNLELIKKWFDNCTTKHDKCREKKQTWYPTRLLHLGLGGRHIRLIITEDNPPDGPYITLSHRWNKERYKKLQSSTIAQLQEGIDVIRLPKTFQDAVRIGRHLGVYYLWIDSLCIKQDKNDPSDWLEESQRMGQVYSSACINISATRSFDGSGFLLGQSSWADKAPTQIELGTSGLLQKHYLVDGSLWDDEIESGSLLRRGWVFQERYLAQRIIHFGESQLGWECFESCMLEMFPDGFPSSLCLPKAKSLGRTLVTPMALSRSTLSPDMKFAGEWQDVASQYSKCELTFSRDKLIALEGIARFKMLERPDDTYVSGMWKSTALYDLPWRRGKEDCVQFPINETSSRAPSWSWASADGEIRFPHSNVFSRVQECYATVKELVGHTIVAQNGNIANDGNIVIEGLCLPLKVEWWNNKKQKIFIVPGFEFSTEKGSLKSAIYLESPMEVVSSLSDSGKLLLLPLYATTHALFGIVLATTHGIETHQRIGAFKIALMTQSIPTPDDQADERLFIETTSIPLQGGLWDSQAKIWSKVAMKFIEYLHEEKTNSCLVTIL